MRETLLILALVSVPGCGQKAAPIGGNNGASGRPAIVVQQPWSQVPAPPPGPPVYQNRTAPQWAERLHAPDQNRRHEASVALRELKEHGYSHLFKGMQSESADVRLLSLQALDMSELVRHQNETMPVIVRMLRDANPNIRRQAAARLAWYGKAAQGALPALKQVAEQDENRDVRDAAAVTMIDIREVLSGKRRPDG